MALGTAFSARRRQLVFRVDSASPAEFFGVQAPLWLPFAHAQAKPDNVARFSFDFFRARRSRRLLRYLFDCRLVRLAVLLVTFQRFKEFLAVLVIGLIPRLRQGQERKFAADFKPLENHVRKFINDADLGLNTRAMGTVQQVVAQRHPKQLLSEILYLRIDVLGMRVDHRPIAR